MLLVAVAFVRRRCKCVELDDSDDATNAHCEDCLWRLVVMGAVTWSAAKGMLSLYLR